MINRHPLIAFLLCLVLIVYLGFALHLSADMASRDTIPACHIAVEDSLSTGFITAEDISQECGNILRRIGTLRRDSVDIGVLEAHLRASDKIEHANVYLLNNGSLQIDVTPMTPVARVFEDNASYYINTVGKRISAEPRYHIDVPVVVGSFPASRPAVRLLPLLDYIAAHPDINALVSTVKQDRNGDIIIVPCVRGHVINFGDTSLVDNKFARVKAFYHKVAPVCGWNTYDTVSVKWRGRITATHRNKDLGNSALAVTVEDFEDFDDVETMTGNDEVDTLMYVQPKP